MKYLLIVLAFLTAQLGSSQDVTKFVISNGGGSVTNGDLNMSWTFGEPIAGTLSSIDGNLILTQGYQQTYTFSTSVKDENFGLELSVYPNPTADMIRLESDQVLKVIKVYDHLGKLLMSQSEQDFKASINFQNLSDGLYYLHILGVDNGRAIKKIIKTR